MVFFKLNKNVNVCCFCVGINWQSTTVDKHDKSILEHFHPHCSGGRYFRGIVTIGGSLLSRGRYFRNSTVIDSKPPPNASLYSGRGTARGAGK